MSGIISYTAFGGRSGILGSAPWFVAREFDTSVGGALSGWIADYNYVDQGPGGLFNNSTGRFTAPVNGVYLFTVQGIKNNREAVVRLYIRKNEVSPGTGLDRGVQVRLDDYGSSDGLYTLGSVQIIYRLKPGDFVSLNTATAYLHPDDGEYGNFTGNYIGPN